MHVEFQFNANEMFQSDYFVLLLYSRETHWYQTVVYVDEPFSVPKGTPLTGSVAMSPKEENDRYEYG